MNGRRRWTSGLAAAGLGALFVVSGGGIGCSGGGGGSTGGMIPPPDSVTLLDVQTQVFSASCALTDCHSGPTAPLGLDLSSVSTSGTNLLGIPSTELPGLLRVAPFDPTDSYLYMKLVDDPRILGDAMPASGPPLGAANLNLIRSWIEQGAP